MRTSWTTREAARAVKISRASLQEWIRRGKIVAPSVRLIKGKAVRVWNASDIKKLHAVKSKIYGQGKGKRRAQ
jgi:predicted site-specific integrase-resolvase